jgi:hypothetical protein
VAAGIAADGVASVSPLLGHFSLQRGDR